MSLPVLSVLSCVCMCCPIVVYNFCVMAHWINAYLAITSQCLSLISELSLLQEVGGFLCSRSRCENSCNFHINVFQLV